MSYFLWQANREHGPFSPAQITSLLQSGRIQADTPARSVNVKQWSKVADIPELQAGFAPVPTPVSGNLPPTTPPQPGLRSPTASPSPPLMTPPPVRAVESPKSHTPLIIGLAAGFFLLLLLGLGVFFMLKTFDNKQKEILAAKENLLEERKDKLESDRRDAQEELDKRAEEIDNQETAAYEEWLATPFDSHLASRFKRNVPSLDTPVYHTMKSYHTETLGDRWKDFSTIVETDLFSGELAYGSPFLTNGGKTLGMVIKEKGLGFRYLQLSLGDGSLRELSKHTYKLDGNYNSIETCRSNNAPLLELICHQVNTNKNAAARYTGLAHYAQLNLDTGEIRHFDRSSKSSGNKDFVLEEILKAKLPETAHASLTSGAKAFESANQSLQQAGLSFDFRRRQLVLDSATRDRWIQTLRPVTLHSGTVSALETLSKEVHSMPKCPLTDDLELNLQFAIATAAEQQENLNGFVKTHSSHYLRNAAAMESLHLIAQNKDELASYLSFQAEDPGTPARDLAVLRAYEMAFAQAMETASLKSFDEFMTRYPEAGEKWDLAYQNAYDLELERSRYIVEHSENPDDRREKVARGMFVRWRSALRSGRLPEAKRLWEILSNEEDFQETDAAVEAQNAQDLDDYRAKVLARMDEQNRILREQNEILKQIRAAEERQASAAEDSAASLRRQAWAAEDSAASLRRISGSWW